MFNKYSFIILGFCLFEMISFPLCSGKFFFSEDFFSKKLLGLSETFGFLPLLFFFSEK